MNLSEREEYDDLFPQHPLSAARALIKGVAHSMVYYYLIENSDVRMLYEYYPGNHRDKRPGIITIDKANERIDLTVPAEEDFERYAEEIDERWWWYYDHAERRIAEDYNNGIIKEVGMAAWH
jgi:hypothetical protein